jgi:hypothetical protein
VLIDFLFSLVTRFLCFLYASQVLFVIKGNTPNCVNSKIQYRSFKDFDVNKYISDLDNTVYLHDSSECVDDINTMYNDFETKVSQVIDHHAPIKYRYPR